MRDRDTVVALWCARRLTAPSGRLPAGAGPRLLGSTRAAVRAFAAGHLTDDLLPREVLRALLADRSGAVRSVARWRWTRRGEDPGPVYRALLAAPLPRQVAAALDGLDDSQGGDCGAAVPARLSSPAWRASRAGHGGHPALAAHGAGRPAASEPLGPGPGRPDRYQRLRPDPAENGRADLLAWLRHDAATTYGKPPPDQAAAIAALLASSTLTGGQRKAVAFVAGIRTPAAPGAPRERLVQ